MTPASSEGVIVKGIGGFYYVSVDGVIHSCKARGLFRKQELTPAVGDRVRLDIRADGESVITEILPRKNFFVRPPVANIDQFILVVALARPEPNLLLIDRFLVMAEYQMTDIVICFNKIDLAEDSQIEELRQIYDPLYPTVFVNGLSGEGFSGLRDYLKNHQSALAGPSGAGKSTLLNRLIGRPVAEVGKVAKRTGRGRHTTRHVELFPVGSGFLYDTPGFTSFDILEADEAELAVLFPEMEALLGACQYDNCRHLEEPGCAVHKAVNAGNINASRYVSYRQMIEEIREKRKY
ncbi:MAG TPA: ribosome small subunit-dependent GTPase A [Clostridiales bacterium]|nr:ribosome small subunit-dependent GTPase A [Clostridiales bacterium]